MMRRYIHEQPDWPQFRWDSAAIEAPLAAVRHRQGLLLGRMRAQGFDLRAAASLNALTADVTKSSEIEGERLNREAVRSSLARRLGLEAAALAPADRHIEGIAGMMLDATQRYDSPLSGERLFAWHAGLFPQGRSGFRRIAAGAWRDDARGAMQVVSGAAGRERVHFEAPAAARLKSEMTAFLDWFNGPLKIDPVLKAGIAHLWFVTLHPFEDGNGRIARAIGDMALARSEATAQRFYSLSAQICAERNAYYGLLETAQGGSLDITAWLSWFLGCLGRAIANADSVAGNVLIKAGFWDLHRDAPFNERQRLMLNRLLDGFDGKLTSSKWAKIAKCSQDSAGRDIADLVARGILQKEEGGGRSTSYAMTAMPLAHWTAQSGAG